MPMTTDAVTNPKETTVVATVNGAPIQLRAFKRQLYKQRAQVISYFKRTHNVEMAGSSTFWTDRHGGETPQNRAKAQALENVIHIKVQQLLASEQGIIDDVRYSAFLTNWKAENKRRAEALSNNQVIYGPTQYSEDQYFEYIFSNMVIKTKEQLEKGKLAPDLEQLRTYYRQTTKDYRQEEPGEVQSFEEAKGAIRSRCIDKNYEQLIQSLTDKAEIEINEKIYNNIEMV